MNPHLPLLLQHLLLQWGAIARRQARRQATYESPAMVAGLLSVSVTVEPARVLGLVAARSGTGSSTLTAWQGPRVHVRGYRRCVLCHS